MNKNENRNNQENRNNFENRNNENRNRKLSIDNDQLGENKTEFSEEINPNNNQKKKNNNENKNNR